MFSGNTSQVSADQLYVEDVFSTYLYTGNSSTQTITNGIDLAGKGGLVWIKSRSAATNNFLFDTTRGVNVELNSNTTDANATLANSVTAFNSNGFAISSATGIGVNAATYASWTFREAPKFFDVVTYTGNGSTQSISHNLGTAPGMIVVKKTSSDGNWRVYHRSQPSAFGNLNATAEFFTSGAETVFGNNSTVVAPTATAFTVGNDTSANQSSQTYVAYLFAHDATSDGVIQCGSYTTTGSDQEVNLGWEPQWVLIKNTDISGSAYTGWGIFDTMRGFTVDLDTPLLANSSSAENGTYNANTYNYVDPTPTGFKVKSGTTLAGAGTAGYKYIYIAIRRGPMKTPTLGTSVFSPVSQTPSGVTTITTGFPVDMTWLANRSKASFSFTADVDRLRGTTQTSTRLLLTNGTDAEAAVNTYGFGYDRMTSITDNYSNSNWGATTPVIYWNFRRAPGFFDEVCYTGTGSARTVSHNLGVAPELMIVKKRNGSTYWAVYAAPLGATKYIILNDNFPQDTDITFWNNTTPTASAFTVGTIDYTNASGGTYVNYLFASCPGVSKVGSYTGTGALQTINCAFTTGARFVLIKRTDGVSHWYVWDSARGISSGNDPYLLLSTTAAEVTDTNYVDTDTTGFKVTAAAPAGINAVGGTYIFLAIA